MPEPPRDLIEDALKTLTASVRCEERESPDSHTVIEVTGLDEPGVPIATARYAVAFLGGWVQRDATIGARLGIHGVDKRSEVARLVDRVIVPKPGLSASAMDTWRRTWRNAWLAEVLTHALFVIHRTTTSAFLAGGVVAIMRPHPLPKRQGLDTVAIYDEQNGAVVAIGETKATRSNASTELRTACDMFDNVDAGLYGPDLRDAIDVMGDVLPDHLSGQISDALWRKNRCYLPAIFHEIPFDSGTRRTRLAQLEPSTARKRVLICRISDFSAFFDATAAAMPDAILELVV